MSRVSAVLINGRESREVGYGDRGLSYGDGVFETMWVAGGRIRLEAFHLERLASGLVRLGIRAPAPRTLRRELHGLARGLGEGVLKLTVTRGSGARGYRPTGRERTLRMLVATPMRAKRSALAQPARLRICRLVLAEQPALAGIKSLNRLESVLARREWRDPRIWDGLLRDGSGNLVCGTMSNLFLRQGDRLLTPPLERCGVKGVMRRWVLGNAARVGLKALEQPVSWSDLRAASEVFMSNAVVGVKSVRAVEWRARGRHMVYADFEAARRLRERLAAI